MAALERVRANLKRYRASVLKAAVEGRLTAKWRAEHPNVEPASKLLDRILVERRKRWEADQLAKFKTAGKAPPKGWQAKYEEPVAPEIASLPELPIGWCWTKVNQLLVEDTCNGISVKGADEPPGVPALKLSAMSDAGFDYLKHRYIPIDEMTANSLAIRGGDFFVARGNGSLHLVGRGTLAQAPTSRIVFPDTMIRLRFSPQPQLSEFISVVWSSRMMRHQVERRARTTAGIYKISQRDIESFVVPLPPLQEQQEIVAEVARRFSLVTAVDDEVTHDVQRSARLRQSILKRAFEGRLVLQDPTDEPASVPLPWSQPPAKSSFRRRRDTVRERM